jgi:hypothetical protein
MSLPIEQRAESVETARRTLYVYQATNNEDTSRKRDDPGALDIEVGHTHCPRIQAAHFVVRRVRTYERRADA